METEALIEAVRKRPVLYAFGDVRCYQIKQRVESTWSHSYIRQAFLFMDQNFVYHVVELPVCFSLQVNFMNSISSPPVIAFLFQTIQNCLKRARDGLNILPPSTSPFQRQSVFAPEKRRTRTAQLPDCRRAGNVPATDSLCQDS